VRHLVVRRRDDAAAHVAGQVGELIDGRQRRPPGWCRTREWPARPGRGRAAP
jgi:hypothetical protein